MDLVTKARIFAEKAHAKQKDKLGVPYRVHLRDVAAMSKLLGGDDYTVAAAWLHDVVEDNVHISPSTLRKAGFPEEVVETVVAVTKLSGEQQTLYLERVIKGGRRPRIVKVADLFNNLRADRLAQLPENTRNRLLKKYRPSLLRLLLELELVVTEDTQAKLAKVPQGTSWTTTAGKPGADGTITFDAHELMGGDWPLDWPAPIAERVKKTGNMFLLSDGTTRTAYGKTQIYTSAEWAKKRATDPQWLPKRSALKSLEKKP